MPSSAPGSRASTQTESSTDLYDAVQTAEPEVGTSAFYGQAVSDLSDVTKARRNRNADAADTIPGPLFFLVVVISFAVLGVATLLNTRERGTHVTLLAVLAVVTALNLALSSPRASVQWLDRGQRPTAACRRARDLDADRPAEDDERRCPHRRRERPARTPPALVEAAARREHRRGRYRCRARAVRRAATGRPRGRTSSHHTSTSTFRYVSHMSCGTQLHAAVGAEVVEQRARGGLRALEAETRSREQRRARRR